MNLAPDYRRVFVCLMLGSLILARSLSAQSLKSDTVERVVLNVRTAKSLLWQISHDVLPHNSYLLAILPQMPASQFFLPPETIDIARHTERLVLAIDPDFPPSDVRYRSSLPLDSTLDRLLPQKQYNSLLSFVKDSLTDLSLEKLQARYPPAILARQFMQDYCLGAREMAPPIWVEQYLRDSLPDMALGVVGTDWSRVDWLDDQPTMVQLQQLMALMSDRHAQCEIFQATWRAYMEPDLDRLWLLAQHVPDLGTNMGKLQEARNERWMHYLMIHLPDESMFMAVPAAQLAGEYGLLHLLRKKGYHVEPIKGFSMISYPRE